MGSDSAFGEPFYTEEKMNPQPKEGRMTDLMKRYEAEKEKEGDV